MRRDITALRVYIIEFCPTFLEESTAFALAPVLLVVTNALRPLLPLVLVRAWRLERHLSVLPLPSPTLSGILPGRFQCRCSRFVSGGRSARSSLRLGHGCSCSTANAAPARHQDDANCHNGAVYRASFSGFLFPYSMISEVPTSPLRGWLHQNFLKGPKNSILVHGTVMGQNRMFF